MIDHENKGAQARAWGIHHAHNPTPEGIEVMLGFDVSVNDQHVDGIQRIDVRANVDDPRHQGVYTFSRAQDFATGRVTWGNYQTALSGSLGEALLGLAEWIAAGQRPPPQLDHEDVEMFREQDARARLREKRGRA